MSSFNLTEALFGKRPEEGVWQDIEIRFDSPQHELVTRKGEDVLEYLDAVEDTKGNNGERGEMTITNLRVIWVSRQMRRTSISIGLNCITNISIKPATSRLRGAVAALFILTRFNTQRFEFIFTSLNDTAQQLQTVVNSVQAAYNDSLLFRELRLRGAVLTNGELKLLSGAEQAYSKVSGVWNLSSDQGNLGSFYITNVRLVWFSSVNDGFNVSIPYMQVKSVRVSDSKFGVALVVETTARSGGYVLGFRVEPRETLDYVHKEITALWQAYMQHPVFGVDYSAGPSSDTPRPPPMADDVEILDTDARGDAWATYSVTGLPSAAPTECREPVYCAELGLAMEAPRDGRLDIAALWGIA